MASYDDYQKIPAEHLREAESLLNSLDPGMFTNDADTLAYAAAKIALANAQMMGSMRR
jgi:hypothetical protein